MRKPSPWTATIIGCLGVACAIASFLWTLYVFQREQPTLMVDCARDFDRAVGSGMGHGGPSAGYYVYDNRSGEARISCQVINTGQKPEVVRRIESTLSLGTTPVAWSVPEHSFALAGKSARDVEFRYRFDWRAVQSNGGTMRLSLITSTGEVEVEKRVVIYPFY